MLNERYTSPPRFGFGAKSMAIAALAAAAASAPLPAPAPESVATPAVLTEKPDIPVDRIWSEVQTQVPKVFSCEILGAKVLEGTIQERLGRLVLKKDDSLKNDPFVYDRARLEVTYARHIDKSQLKKLNAQFDTPGLDWTVQQPLSAAPSVNFWRNYRTDGPLRLPLGSYEGFNLEDPNLLKDTTDTQHLNPAQPSEWQSYGKGHGDVSADMGLDMALMATNDAGDEPQVVRAGEMVMPCRGTVRLEFAGGKIVGAAVVKS